MFKSGSLAIAVVIILILRAITVPLVSALFGATIGFMFPDTTEAFMQYIKFETVAFWQLMLLVGAISMIWGLGSSNAMQTGKVK